MRARQRDRHAAAKAEAGSMLRRAEASMKPIRVLVVASDPADRAAEADAVRAMPGVRLVGAASGGTEALRQSARRRPDVVLMDLLMPRASGLQVGARLKRRIGAPRVVLVSLGGEPGFSQAAREFGIDAVVPRHELPAALPPLLSRLFPPPGAAPVTDRETRTQAGGATAAERRSRK
jgi:DNA-binding NarL/FixJ family response regulator